MPEQRIIEVKPHQLAKGDVIQNDKRHVVAGRPEVKQKYAYVPLEGFERKAKMAMDEALSVSREFPTAEEQAEQNQRRNEEYCYGTYGALIERLAEKKAELVDNLDVKDPTWHGRIWEDIAAVQYELELWESVMTVAENREINVVEALRLVRDHTREDFPRRYTFLPNSTSPISNFCNQLKNAVTAQWLRELEYRLY